MTKRVAWLVVSLVAVSAVILVIVGTRQGPNLSPDSANYVSGARNLAAGRGYVNYSFQPITAFPPGFSTTLALGDRIGLNALDGARWLNVFALGLLVILTFILACRHVQRTWLAVVAAAAVGFAPPLLDVFTWAWTEPVFCVVVIGLLLTLESLLTKRGRDPYLIALAGLLASVGFTYRYAGSMLLALSVLIVGVAAWRDGAGAIIRRTVLCLAVASVLPALIIARNLSKGTALGERPASIATLGGIIRELRSISSGWVTAERSLPLHLGELAVVGAIAIIALGFMIAFRKYGFRGHAPGAAPLLPLAVFVVGYLAYIVISELQTRIDPLDNRLLSPIFAPAVILMAISVEQLLNLDWITSRRWVVKGTAALIVLWLSASLAQSANHARLNGESGQGYAARSWTQSDLAAAVRQLPSAARLYSNTPDGLYFAAARQPIYSSPASRAHGSYATTDELPAFRRTVEQSSAIVYLAWRTPEPRPYLVTPADLRRNGLRTDPVRKTRDGSIYRVTRP